MDKLTLTDLIDKLAHLYGHVAVMMNLENTPEEVALTTEAVSLYYNSLDSLVAAILKVGVK